MQEVGNDDEAMAKLGHAASWHLSLPQYKRYELNSYAFLSPVSCREQRIDNRDIGSRNTIITIPAVRLHLLGACPKDYRVIRAAISAGRRFCVITPLRSLLVTS